MSDPVVSTVGTALISVSDLGTVVAFAIEQQLCHGKVNWMNAGATGIIGVVSRLTESWLSGYLPAGVTLSSDQKNELVVFVLSALYSRATDAKRSSLIAGFRSVQADLMGVYMVSFLGMEDKTLIGMPGGS